MTKVKIFEFSASKTCYDGTSHELIEFDKQEAERQINDFLQTPNINLIDIKVNVVEKLVHNNGGFNNNTIIYTVIYRDFN